MNLYIEQFKTHVIEAASNPTFLHHTWYVQYHLNIVETIALELCDKYSTADRDLVHTLVWLHDYGKIIDRANQYETTLTQGKQVLLAHGFDPTFSDKAVEYVDIMDKKIDLWSDATPIEIKIISSADGCAHLVGPFFSLWWYENADKTIPELLAGNVAKTMKDWDKKIVLPEAQAAFESRHRFILEQNGQIPTSFIS